MKELAFIAVLSVVILAYLSLKFRHDYLRQKCLNRMTPDEIEQMNKTDLDFWSFLK